MLRRLRRWRISWRSSSPGCDSLELKARLDATAHVAARCGLEVAEIGLVDDYRADVVAIGEVIDAGELADTPLAAPLPEAHRKVPDREAVREVAVRIVNRHTRATQCLHGGVERALPVAQLAVELIARHTGQRGAGRHIHGGGRGGDRCDEAFAERGIKP